MLSLTFENGLGVEYTLEKDSALFFGKIQLSENKKLKAYIRNHDTNRVAENVLIEAIEHPTEPIGGAKDTYESTTFSLTESGTFTPTLTINIPANSQTGIWVSGTEAYNAQPGWGFFAIKAKGEYSV